MSVRPWEHRWAVFCVNKWQSSLAFSFHYSSSSQGTKKGKARRTAVVGELVGVAVVGADVGDGDGSAVGEAWRGIRG